MIYNSSHTGQEIDDAVDKVGTLETQIANKQDKLSDEQIQNINDIPNKQDALLPDELSDIRDIPNIRSQVDTNGSALREFEELTFTYENGDTATLKVVVKRD